MTLLQINILQWDSLFQHELSTQEQSLVFVKRMLVLAVSSITYLRGIFPEDAYRSRYLEGIQKDFSGLKKFPTDRKIS